MGQDHARVPASALGESAIIPSTGSDATVIHGDARAASDLYDRIAGLFVDDSFAEEVDAYIQAERQREREEAAKKADG